MKTIISIIANILSKERLSLKYMPLVTMNYDFFNYNEVKVKIENMQQYINILTLSSYNSYIKEFNFYKIYEI